MSEVIGRPLALLLATVLVVGACATATPARRGVTQVGKASWYGGRFHGRKTASGERFDKNAMTAAHKKLPFGTRVRVTHERTGRSVVVRINDRGPFAPGRVIDLSEAAARRLGMIEAGVVPVTLEILSTPD